MFVTSPTSPRHEKYQARHFWHHNHHHRFHKHRLHFLHKERPLRRHQLYQWGRVQQWPLRLPHGLRRHLLRTDIRPMQKSHLPQWRHLYRWQMHLPHRLLRHLLRNLRSLPHCFLCQRWHLCKRLLHLPRRL